jgi:hypothetical protein
MLRFFVHVSFLFFSLVALTGAWMRYYPFAPGTSIPYSHVLHAHSHFALLGWAFMGCFVLFLHFFWERIRLKKQAILAASAMAGISLAMLFAFLYQGYGPLSIAVSTLHIFAEYWAAFIFYRTVRENPAFSEIGGMFIKGSLAFLLLSSAGPFSLAFIAARGMKETPWYDMAIYFYLHFQYNGWLLLFLIGMFVLWLRRKAVPFDAGGTKAAFWMYVIALFPGYFHSILWMEPGKFVEGLAVAAGVVQFVAVLLLFRSFRGSWRHLRRKCSGPVNAGLLLTMLALLVKSALELGLLLPGLTDLVYDTRSVVIGYLHLTLLGFVSFFILIQYIMAGIWEADKQAVHGISVFYAGFLLNELLLFMMGLAEWIEAPQLPFRLEGLLLAGLMLLAGILLMWRSFARGGSGI